MQRYTYNVHVHMYVDIAKCLLPTYIAFFCCWTNADVQVFTSLKIWTRGAGRLERHVSPSNVLGESLALHLTNVKPLGIVISHVLLLSAPVIIKVMKAKSRI